MGDQEYKLEEVFESAVALVRNLPSEGPIKPPDSLKLKLYAYFKQATYGPNNTPKPRFYQLVEVYKWDAWRKLGDMSREEAMSNYVSELKEAMQSVSQDESDPDDNKQFEIVLGKKFYDYWFNEWQGKKSQQLSTSSDGSQHLMKSVDGGGGTAGTSSSSSSHLSGLTQVKTRPNDAHSSSSENSSMSMLEETQSPDGDGYKTPNSLDKCNISSQTNDQFALAVLRLQNGLDKVNSRLKTLEAQVSRSIENIRALESQTYPKKLIEGDSRVASHRDSQGRNRPKGGTKKLINLLRQIGSPHWFYLAYPIIVYALFRAFEKRKRQLER